MRQRPILSLRLINHCLLLGIVLVNGYVIAAPFWPYLHFWWEAHHTATMQHLTEKITPQPPQAATEAGNRLIIPAMLLDQPTLEGPKSNWFGMLKQGIWRWPDSSTPDKGGNTVFLAHRFSYTGPRGAFYFLNKLQPGDHIGVQWAGKTYRYQVVSSTEVPPTDVAVEQPTPDARLTLFTCTPLWHPVNRLVVVAKLEAHS